MLASCQRIDILCKIEYAKMFYTKSSLYNLINIKRRDVLSISQLLETQNVKVSKTSITKDELINGFDLTIETTNGVRFDTSCTAYGPRVSIIRTANMSLEVLPYCNAISGNKITFYIKALNDVSKYADTLEFRMEGSALLNSSTPLDIKLDIKSNANQSDLDKLTAMAARGEGYDPRINYTKESREYYLKVRGEALDLLASSSKGDSEVKAMVKRLSDAINKLERL